jgi:hypothetical protein
MDLLSFTSNPATNNLPEVKGERQAIIRIVVDFPAPFSPKIAKVSPLLTLKVMSLTAQNSLNTFIKF